MPLVSPDNSGVGIVSLPGVGVGIAWVPPVDFPLFILKLATQFQYVHRARNTSTEHPGNCAISMPHCHMSPTAGRTNVARGRRHGVVFGDVDLQCQRNRRKQPAANNRFHRLVPTLV